MRLAAKMRPSKRSPRRLPIASRQVSAVKPSRSKIPVSSAEIEAFPCRKSWPVYSTSLIGHGNWLAKFVSSRKQPSPTLNDLEIGPPLSNFGIKPQEHMQVIVHHRKPTDGHGEDFRKFLEPVFEPLPTRNRQVHPIQAVTAKPSRSPIPSTRSADANSRW